MIPLFVVLAVIGRPPSGRSNPVAVFQDTVRSTRSGVYLARQATEGATVYALNCTSCHTPASHNNSAFAAKWEGRPLAELFEYLRSSMPKSEPGSLTNSEYIQILAYLLKLNGMPAGEHPLPADSLELRKIRIELKAPAPADPRPNR